VSKVPDHDAAQHIAAMSRINEANTEMRWFVAERGARVGNQIGGFRLRPAWTGSNMSISMYNSSVAVFAQFLGSLSHLLDRAADHAEARKIDPATLLNARLYPNMYNLTRQVGEAIRHAVLSTSLLVGVDPPVYPDAEPDISELKARIATAIEFVRNLSPAEINGAASKEVVFTFRSGSTRSFTGQSLLLTFSVPQFFFHVTTAYDILRHCGVDLGKKDFLGTPSELLEG
jgi:hypothetical protein